MSTIARSSDARPTLPLLWLDTLWVQVTGTVCNIACKHCFISCGPNVETHRMMSVTQIRRALDDGVDAGMRSVWYTGGEPLLHPSLLELVDLALARTPLGILTNGMGIDDAMAESLALRFREALYNLEIRVSLDGHDAATNDRIRGKGVFDATCAGIARLAAHGIEPVVAVALVDGAVSADQQTFARLLRSLGVTRPRVRWIPPFRLGREATRRGGRPYREWEHLTQTEVEDPEAPHRLQCGTSRCVTAEGAFPCPILINEPSFRLGNSLADALRPHPVDHRACHTCWVEGFSCSA